MTSTNIPSLKNSRFKKELYDLAGLDTIADDVFADCIYRAMSEFGVSEADLRDSFGLSGGSVERWTMSKNLPQPMVRAKILRTIAASLITEND